jgi:hypothetical protein
MAKIAVYGVYETKKKVPVPQRFWKTRRAYAYMRAGKLVKVPAGKRRYWKKVMRTKWVEGKGRYEFEGKGKDLYKAIVKAHEYMPKGYVKVEAKKFLDNPEQYGEKGRWIERDVESP